MPDYTQHYNLIKPKKGENYDIDDVTNTNMDIIDTQLENKVEKIPGKSLSTCDFTPEYEKKLKGLNNYDDTKIKQDISNIKQNIDDIQKADEKQDEDIADIQATNTKQDELIQKLKDNSINVTTEESTQIHVEDASELPAKLEVRGNHYQKTVKGIQILGNTNEGTTGWAMSTDPFDLGVMEEVSYLRTRACKFKTTAEATNWMYISRNVNLSKLKNNTTYTIQFDIKTNYNKETINVYIQDGSATNQLADFGYVNNVNGERRIKLVATTNDTEIVNQILYIGLYALDNNSSNELIITNLILVEGDYSDTDLEWEEYTGLQGSPSLDYPSEVKAVGDNVNIFNIETITENMFLEGFHDYENYGQTNSSSVTNVSDYIPVKKGDYTLSYDFEEVLNIGNRGYCFYDEEKNVINQGVDTYYPIQVKEYVITAPQNGYVRFGYDKNCTNIKLEAGTEATSYSPHGQGSVEITKHNANWLNLSNASAYNVNYTFENDKLVISTDGIHGSNNIEIDILELFKRNAGKNIAFQFEKLEISNIDAMNMIVVQIHTINNGVHNYQSIVRKDGSRYEYVIPNNVEGLTFAKLQIFANNSNDIINNSVSITKPMLLLAKTTDATVTYQRYEEQSLVLDIQKPMLLGDYFDLSRGKEVHVWSQKELVGTEEGYLIVMETFNTDTYKIIQNKTIFSNPELSPDIFSLPGNVISNYFKSKSGTAIRDSNVEGINIWDNTYTGLIFGVNCSSVDEFKQILAEKYASGNPVKVYYKLATPEELDLTEEQKSVLQQLSELELFKGTNNIITAESLALMQMSYIADTQSYIDKQIDEKLANINAQILEIAGGN